MKGNLIQKYGCPILRQNTSCYIIHIELDAMSIWDAYA